MIKGRATIQLFDEKSGEVVKELHEENMITNAVDTMGVFTRSLCSTPCR